MLFYVLLVICLIYVYRRGFPEENRSFPRTIMLTTKDKSKIPQYILDQYARYAPEYRLSVYDDGECREYLKRYYSDKVLQKFDSLDTGAHKADLFRYAYLYREGGCYMDVKTILTRPLSEVFGEHNFYLIKGFHPKSIYNGVIVTPPSNRYILELLTDLVHERTRHTGYLRFVNHAYDVLTKYARPQVGINRMKQVPNLYLMKEKHFEKCDGGRDRYNLCMKCVDEHGDVMFKIRDPNYHKTWS